MKIGGTKCSKYIALLTYFGQYQEKNYFKLLQAARAPDDYGDEDKNPEPPYVCTNRPRKMGISKPKQPSHC